MSQIRILPEILSNKIAAGEVVERPASVVKELLENSLDAESTQIVVEIEKGGRSLIRVSDNGMGMPPDDALLSIERYATSKIYKNEDLFSIRTLGFRGEALPSIASVSRFSLITRNKDADTGLELLMAGGRIQKVTEIGAPVGTQVSVRQLFFNTPARRKFLKGIQTEMGHIADVVSTMALGRPGVQFKLLHNNKLLKNWVDLYLRVLHRPTSGSLLLGQKRGSRSSQDSIKNAVFDKDVFEMMWQDGQYKSGGLYPLPAGITLYDFSRSDALNKEQDKIVAFSSKGNIMVYNQNGETTWKSTEEYGGSRQFIEVPKASYPSEAIRYYLPHRIHVTDFDRDGLNEIIVLKNIDSAKLLPRTKIFKKGYVASLSYDDIGTQLKWQTRQIIGYISDYVIGDFNNDGIKEIVMSVVTKKQFLLNKGKSYIISCRPTNE